MEDRDNNSLGLYRSSPLEGMVSTAGATLLLLQPPLERVGAAGETPLSALAGPAAPQKGGAALGGGGGGRGGVLLLAQASESQH